MHLVLEPVGWGARPGGATRWALCGYTPLLGELYVQDVQDAELATCHRCLEVAVRRVERTLWWSGGR